MNPKFNMTIPAILEKNDEGQWRIFGRASTDKVDRQGEIVHIKGLDLSPIEKGKGLWNFDHKKGPENTIGIIDTYKKTDNELYLGGYLFKNHDRAKSVYQIMSSLSDSDRGRVGLSVEGVIKERAGKDGRIIKKAEIHSCAITMNPVNEDTYANLIKSMSEVEFSSDALEENIIPEASAPTDTPELTFSTSQVVALLHKALGVGTGYATTTPANLSGGDALSSEDLDKKPKDITNIENPKKPEDKKERKPKKSLKKGDIPLAKSRILDIMDGLSTLYPEVPKSALWEMFKDRLNKKFEDM